MSEKKASKGVKLVPISVLVPILCAQNPLVRWQAVTMGGTGTPFRRWYSPNHSTGPITTSGLLMRAYSARVGLRGDNILIQAQDVLLPSFRTRPKSSGGKIIRRLFVYARKPPMHQRHQRYL